MKPFYSILALVLLAMIVAPAQSFAQCTAPAPGDFKSTPLSSTSTSLSWNPVAGSSSYRLTVINTSTNATVLNNVLVNGTARTVTALNNSDTYSASVRVQCSAGNVSPNAATLSFEICLLPAPTGFDGVPVDNGAVGTNIEWSWDTLPGALSYMLDVLDVNTGVHEVFSVFGTTFTTPAVIGHTYTATVAGVCPNGEVSPNFASRTLEAIIIDDVVQLSNPGCGMGDNTCQYPTPTGYNLISNIATTIPVTITFQTGESRRVLKFKVVESNNLLAASPFIEFKLAFEPSSNTVYFKSGAASTNYSTVIGMGGDIEMKKYAATQGIFQIAGYSAIGNTTTFNLQIAKSTATRWKFSHWLCRTCIANPMAGDDEAAMRDGVPLDFSSKKEVFLPQTLALGSFPNPAKNVVSLRIELPSEQVASLVLYDAMGQLVREFFRDEWHEAGLHDFEPALGDLPPGVYRCVLRTTAGEASCSIIKQ